MSFTLDLKNEVEAMKGNTENVARKVVLDLETSLVFRSPVGDTLNWLSLHPVVDLATKKQTISGKGPAGYVGGRFRCNWQHGFNAVPSGNLYGPNEPSYPCATETIDALKVDIDASPAAGIHYLTNNVEYAQALEDGHSNQAPSGMVTLAMIEFPGIVRKAQE